MISIAPYQKKFQQEIFNLITAIQKENGIVIRDEDQPDLFNIEKFCDNFWVALDEKKRVIGTIALIVIGNAVQLRKMFVSKDWRGLGVSQKLLKTFEKECQKRKIKKIYLGTNSKLKAACKFYEKCGFKPIDQKKLPKKFGLVDVDDRFFVKEVSFAPKRQ
jgi:N-acetylglutamate synthase-like GNAT family acetyltransferase